MSMAMQSINPTSTPPVFPTFYQWAQGQIVTDPMKLSDPCVETTKERAVAVIAHLIEVGEGLDQGPLHCAGLAANQIGAKERVIIVKLGGKFNGYVNPVIIRKNGAVFDSTETCFSFPGKTATARRYPMITLKADNLLAPQKFKGHEAVVFQHEIDHLNGVLI